MQNKLSLILEKLTKEISESEVKEEALQRICAHHNGEQALSDDELADLENQYGISTGEFCYLELEEVEGYLAGLRIAVQEINNVQN